jgi:hypothetical protein
MFKNSILIYLLLIIIISIVLPDEWHIVTVDKSERVGLGTSIALDSNGYPYISYYDEYNDCLKLAKWVGNSWKINIIDNETIGTSTVIDSNDHIHIAYYDSNIELKYAYYNGNYWHIEVVDTSTNVYGPPSIDLDKNNYPHISYTTYGGHEIKYAYWDGSKWNIQYIDKLYSSACYSDIALDSRGYPHISYGDASHTSLRYAYWDGRSWHKEIIDSNGNGGSIAIDSKNHPYIAYFTRYDYYLRCAHFDGSKWNIDIIDTNALGAGSSRWIAVDSNDRPHVSYYNNGLVYAYFDGDKWNKEIIDSEGNSGKFSSIFLDKNDKPHISYADYPYYGLKYAWYGYGVGIDLTSFTAKPDNNAITLNWSVTTDENISGFNLYRRIISPGAIHELPLQYTPVGTGYNLSTNTTTVGEDLSQRDSVPGDDNPCPDTDTQWTKVNTSLITGTNPYSYTDRTVESETAYEYKLEAVTSDRQETLGTTSVTSGKNTPSSFEITKIYPTPADSQINVAFIIPLQENIDMSIYDITGRKVSTVISGLYNPGEYTMLSDVSGLINGVYIVRMTADEFSASKNFIVAR